MEGVWGHEQGVNNTFCSSLDREITLLITAPLSQRDPKRPDTFPKLPVHMPVSPHEERPPVFSENWRENVGLPATQLASTEGSCLSPHRFPQERNVFLNRT